MIYGYTDISGAGMARTPRRAAGLFFACPRRLFTGPGGGILTKGGEMMKVAEGKRLTPAETVHT